MGRSNLYVSRLKSIGIEVYKCIQNINPPFLDMFNIRETTRNLRDGNTLIQPKVNTIKFGINSFSYQGSKLWNNLPVHIKSAQTLSQFKSRIHEWEGPACLCGSCILCSINMM